MSVTSCGFALLKTFREHIVHNTERLIFGRNPLNAIHLDTITNIRDFGGTPVSGTRTVKSGLMYRGSALHGASAGDLSYLFDELGIACVIDLRCGWEVEARPNDIPSGVDYLHIPFYDMEKVGIEYTERVEGTKAIGRDIACVPLHLYRHMANRLTTAQMRDALSEFFSHAASGKPVYVHCSGGKDRAGILSLLALTILGASRETVLEDYLFTNVSRDKHYDKMFERFFRFTGDEQRAHELVMSHRALPENIDAFYGAVDEEYGSFESFLVDQLEFPEERRQQLRNACTTQI